MSRRAQVESSVSLRALQQRQQQEEVKHPRLSVAANGAGDDDAYYRPSRLRLVLVAMFGGLLGMGLCFGVNAILFEISLSRIFAFYFGIIYCVLGAVMLLRSFFQPTLGKQAAVFGFSLLVIAAGIVSLVFQTEWLWTLPAGTKIFIYSLLGVSTSFCITFAYLDILSFFHDNAVYWELESPDRAVQPATPQATRKLGLFESANQVWLILVLSILTGFTYGITFGTQEEHGLAQAQKQHQREEVHVDFFVKSLGNSLAFTIPFGFVLGVLGALANELLRRREILHGTTGTNLCDRRRTGRGRRG